MERCKNKEIAAKPQGLPNKRILYENIVRTKLLAKKDKKRKIFTDKKFQKTCIKRFFLISLRGILRKEFNLLSALCNIFVYHSVYSSIAVLVSIYIERWPSG